MIYQNAKEKNMIFYLIMCQILLSLLQVTNSDINDRQKIVKRFAHDSYNSHLRRLKRDICEYSLAFPTSTGNPWNYKITENGQNSNGEKVNLRLLSPKDKLVDKEIATGKLVDIGIDHFDRKTELPNVKFEEDNDVPFFESIHFNSTTETYSFKCIEKPPDSQLNFKCPHAEISENKKGCQKLEEVTVLPVTCPIGQCVDLVFPLEGEPPPLYQCFEVKKNPNSSKTVKIFKQSKPNPFKNVKDISSSESDSSVSERSLKTTNPIKVKRQGYWVELHSPSSTEQSSKQLSKSKVHNIFKPKNNKIVKKQKIRRNKKKKVVKLDETTETSISNTVIYFSYYQTEPAPHDVEQEKCASKLNETLKFDLMHIDQEKIFIENKELEQNRTECESHQNNTETLQANNTYWSPTPYTIKEETVKPVFEDNSTMDKPSINDKIWEKPSFPTLKDIFNLSTLKQATVTEETTNSLSTKSIYGHELHV